MHSEPNSLKFCYFRPIRLALASAFLALIPTTVIGDEALPYAEHFNPANGFKPAQRNLTAIFLQMAGSFEHYGTPANYLRHANAEAMRVEAAWLKAKGKPAKFRPEYFTEEYIEKLITGWNQMERVLALESFTRNSGRQIRYAILGTSNVPASELASLEGKLNKEESMEFQRFISKPFFRKSDLPAAGVFYKDGSGFDKLSEAGKAEINKRVWRGMMDKQRLDADLANARSGTVILSILGEHQQRTVAWIEGKGKATTSDELQTALIEGLRLRTEEVDYQKLDSSSRDATVYSHSIRKALARRLTEIQKQATPQQLEDIQAATTLMMENLLVAARLEFEAGLWDGYLKR